MKLLSQHIHAHRVKPHEASQQGVEAYAYRTNWISPWETEPGLMQTHAAILSTVFFTSIFQAVAQSTHSSSAETNFRLQAALGLWSGVSRYSLADPEQISSLPNLAVPRSWCFGFKVQVTWTIPAWMVWFKVRMFPKATRPMVLFHHLFIARLHKD